MSQMLRTTLGRLRLIGLVEGTSYLVLLLVAMPLKYAAGIALAVRVCGMIHGVLFIAFGLALAAAFGEKKLSFSQSALVFLSSLLPFGTYVIDGRLKRIESER